MHRAHLPEFADWAETTPSDTRHGHKPLKIQIFTTGGTIDKIYFDAKGGYEVGESIVPNILNRGRVQINLEITEILRKDSLDLNEYDRREIREGIRGAKTSKIIVTHGTDTMVETGRMLEEVSGKTTVLTGALQPGRFFESDAAFNLGMAIAAVQILPPGVYVAVNGLVAAASKLRKDRVLNCFEVI